MNVDAANPKLFLIDKLVHLLKNENISKNDFVGFYNLLLDKNITSPSFEAAAMTESSPMVGKLSNSTTTVAVDDDVTASGNKRTFTEVSLLEEQPPNKVRIL